MAYTITFARGAYGSGGTVPASITANSGDVIRLPDYPGFTRSGAKMCGWTVSDGDTISYFWYLFTAGYAWEHNAAFTVTENVTLYPLWGDDSVGPYFSSVRTVTTGGTERNDLGRVSWVKDAFSTSDSEVSLFFGAKEGYVYDSATVTCTSGSGGAIWTYDLPDPTNGDTFFGSKNYSSATIVARYRPLTYNVVCSPGSYGSGTAQTLTKTHGETLTLPGAIFTRAGYTQTGWATSDGGALAYQLGGSYTANAATTLYPVWSGVALTVTFNATGGYVTQRTASVYYGAAYGTLPTPRRTGYTFAGWWTDATGGTQVVAATTVTAVTDHAIFAHWSKDTICVVLDPNGGDLAPSSLWINVASGVYPALPTATGLVGWFTAATGGTQKTQGSALASSADHVLYAHWTPTVQTRTLYFNATGGVSATSSKTVTVGAAVGTLPTPTRTGYTFAGWFRSTVGSNQVTAATIATNENLTVYAHWTAQTLTLTFDANGGTVSEATRTVSYGCQYLTLPVPVRNGYSFAGWFTAATGGEAVSAATVATASVTLYAHWTDGAVPWGYVRYRIKLVKNGGVLASAYGELKYVAGYAKALPTSAEITRSGYTFAGWYAAEDFSGSAVTTIPASASGTQTFYAKWT